MRELLNRTVLIFIVLASVVVFAFENPAGTTNHKLNPVPNHTDAIMTPFGPGDFVPWPLNLQIPFPWSDVQGIWRAEDVNGVSFYNITKNKDLKTGVQVLSIKQFEAGSCKIIAEGKGIERQKLVTAQMYDFNLKYSYKLTLGAFMAKDIFCKKNVVCDQEIANSDEFMIILSKPSFKSKANARNKGVVLEKVTNDCDTLLQE